VGKVYSVDSTVSIHHHNFAEASQPSDGVESRVHHTKCDHLLDTIQLTDEKASKRAERKLLTQLQVQNLMQLDSPLYNAYERTSTCSGYLFLKKHSVTGETKLTANYCGKRWCSVCSATKTAEMMQNYKESLEALPDLHFVTLTVVSVEASQLKDRIRQMNETFKQIRNLMHKRGISFNGFRKTECNFNAEAETFNPHYHLIVSGELQAFMLMNLWLERNEGTKFKAQDIKKADSDSFMELFKYQFKAVVSAEFNPQAQDTIYRAFNGIRAFQPFGNVHKCPTNAEHSAELSEYGVEADKPLQGEWQTVDVFVWNPYYYNWLNDKAQPFRKTTIRDKIHAMAETFSSV
jgi:plasmid rolling circle replication initiator protein Rep